MVARGWKAYRYRITFDAPLPFVFRWCTDYRPTDARLEGERYERRVLRRTPRTVVYEDLEETGGGWAWRRHVVTLHPPHRWHSDSVGNYREIVLDYELRPVAGGRTQMRFRARRRPSLLAGRNPSSRAFGSSMDASWRRFRRLLEDDYRRSVAGGRPRRAGRRGRR
jgi:hypothetical protein